MWCIQDFMLLLCIQIVEFWMNTDIGGKTYTSRIKIGCMKTVILQILAWNWRLSIIWIFPQIPNTANANSTIFIFGGEKIIYTTRLTFLSCIYTSPSPYREFQTVVFTGFLSILCKSFTLILTIFYKTIHEFISMQLKEKIQDCCTNI